MPRDHLSVPTLLVTGCNGQIGFELCRSLAPLGRVIALDHAACDLTNSARLRDLVRDIVPSVIVNAAAYTAVDKAENNADLAFAINGDAPGILAEEASALDALLVHYSTDYVFDGTADGPYSESDAPNPLSVYGESKLAGEEAVLATKATSLVLRTSWVFGAYGSNFAKTMLKLGRDRDTLRIVSDQFGAPTPAGLVADVTAHIVARHWLLGHRAEFPAGLYHLAAGGDTNWHAYALEVLRQVAERGVVLKVDPRNIQPIGAADYPLPARRPANSRLATTKLRETFGLHLPHWRDGLSLVMKQLLSETSS